MPAAEAQAKLEKALDRLESAALGLKSRATFATQAPVSNDNSVDSERDALRAELDRSRADNAALERRNAEATQRLDAAITRLRGALED